VLRLTWKNCIDIKHSFLKFQSYHYFIMLRQCALHLQIKVTDKVLIKKIELLFSKNIQHIYLNLWDNSHRLCCVLSKYSVPPFLLTLRTHCIHYSVPTLKQSVEMYETKWTVMLRKFLLTYSCKTLLKNSTLNKHWTRSCINNQNALAQNCNIYYSEQITQCFKSDWHILNVL